MLKGLHFLCEIGIIICRNTGNPLAERTREAFRKTESISDYFKAIILNLERRSMLHGLMDQPESTELVNDVLVFDQFIKQCDIFHRVLESITKLRAVARRPMVQVQIPDQNSPPKGSQQVAGTKRKAPNVEIIDLEASEDEYTFESDAETAVKAISDLAKTLESSHVGDVAMKAERDIHIWCERVKTACHRRAKLEVKQRAYKTIRLLSRAYSKNDGPIAKHVKEAGPYFWDLESASNAFFQSLTDEDILSMRSTWEFND